MNIIIYICVKSTDILDINHYPKHFSPAVTHHHVMPMRGLLVALFPFSVAEAVSNRSRKSFVFWQFVLGGAVACGLVGEFQLPIHDWPQRCNCSVSSRCRVPPPRLHPAAPRTPDSGTTLSSCTGCHTLFARRLKCDSQHRLCLPEYRTDNWRDSFDAHRASCLFGDTLWRLPFCHVSGFACALMRAGHHMLCDGR